MSYSLNDAWHSLQQEVGEWADKTFPESTPESMLTHIERELKELRDSGEPEEIADIILILMHYAHRRGINIYPEILEKFRVCRGRKWGKPDAQGVRHHVKK